MTHQNPHGPEVARPLLAGIVYFAIIFVFAFAIGVVRTTIVAPAVGTVMAVIIEVPIIIAASWLVAQRIVRRFALAGVGAQAISGLVAFLLLMLAEVWLARLLNGQPAVDWGRSLLTVAGIIGLGGQIIFALMPLLVGRCRATTP